MDRKQRKRWRTCSSSQMRRRRGPFVHAAQSARTRAQGGLADHLRHPPCAHVWLPLTRLPCRLWRSHQPLRPLQPVVALRFLEGGAAELAKAGWSDEAAAIDANYVKADRSAQRGRSKAKLSAPRVAASPPRSDHAPSLSDDAERCGAPRREGNCNFCQTKLQSSSFANIGTAQRLISDAAHRECTQAEALCVHERTKRRKFHPIQIWNLLKDKFLFY